MPCPPRRTPNLTVPLTTYSGQSFSGVRKSKTSTPSDALETIVTNLPNIGQDLIQVEYQSAGKSMSNDVEPRLLVYNLQLDALELPVPAESALKIL
ncbi:hypothetical protein FS837_003868 [Tulasnella sp. UAMH 9824]|nr:hypothetical protein FS837_003868 [Tulasnella sp. UAMH 9824]